MYEAGNRDYENPEAAAANPSTIDNQDVEILGPASVVEIRPVGVRRNLVALEDILTERTASGKQCVY